MVAAPLLEKLDVMARDGADLQSLLEAAVAGLHASNPRFHWTGIYELFADGALRLGPFVGAPTEHVFIGHGQGVCGTAIAERRNLNIPDVSKAPNYLACSTETRSELVVLIRSGEVIHGQIDVDSHDLAAFDEHAVAAVEAVAGWLAKAYDLRSAPHPSA